MREQQLGLGVKFVPIGQVILPFGITPQQDYSIFKMIIVLAGTFPCRGRAMVFPNQFLIMLALSRKLMALARLLFIPNLITRVMSM
jgi:hypothetical protein